MRRGTELMGALHGDRARLGYAAPDNPITGALYPTAIQYGYGEIWFRPGLERRQRALVAVAAFTALRLPEQVAKFGQSALNIGLSETEVVEAIIQTAPATGFPPALPGSPRGTPRMPARASRGPEGPARSPWVPAAAARWWPGGPDFPLRCAATRPAGGAGTGAAGSGWAPR